MINCIIFHHFYKIFRYVWKNGHLSYLYNVKFLKATFEARTLLINNKDNPQF